MALLRRPLKWSSATGTVDAKLLDLHLTCPGRGKMGWLFESFVGMATRHLYNSETLAEEGLFLTCEEEPFQFFSF